MGVGKIFTPPMTVDDGGDNKEGLVSMIVNTVVEQVVNHLTGGGE
jgi:hypothetical protein